MTLRRQPHRLQTSTVDEVIATASELVREAQKNVAQSMKLYQHSRHRRLRQLRMSHRARSTRRRPA